MDAELKKICQDKYKELKKALINETDTAKKFQIQEQIKGLEKDCHPFILKPTTRKNKPRKIQRKLTIRSFLYKQLLSVYNAFSWKVFAISFSFIIFALVAIYFSIPFLEKTEQAKTEQIEVASLIWTSCPFGQILQNNICIGEVKKLTWDEAIKAAQDYSLGNRNNWRMPTIADLNRLNSSLLKNELKETWLYNINQNDVTKASFFENGIIKEDDTSHLHPVFFVRTFQ